MAELRFISSWPLRLDASNLVRHTHLPVIILLNGLILMVLVQHPMVLVQHPICCMPVLEAMLVFDQLRCIRFDHLFGLQAEKSVLGKSLSQQK